MKEKLNLRNAILWTVALMALSLFFASFGATATLKGAVEGDYISMTCRNAIWGSGSIIGYADGSPIGEFLAKKVVNIYGLIGAILLLLASGGIVATTFLVKEEKQLKFFPTSAAEQSLLQVSYSSLLVKPLGMSFKNG